ncbi:winged helix domain-containing protein [Bradyrhizobium commune]|uniref:winged helix domain-containing protein n=1 Tax=Bradyrhizobium commune TaxID=83627 RepID=UPI0034A50044
MQIVDEGRFRARTVEARGEQGVLLDVQGPARLLLQPRLDATRIFAPGAEFAAEGMQHQHAPELSARAALDGSGRAGQDAGGEPQAETEPRGRD